MLYELCNELNLGRLEDDKCGTGIYESSVLGTHEMIRNIHTEFRPVQYSSDVLSLGIAADSSRVCNQVVNIQDFSGKLVSLWRGPV